MIGLRLEFAPPSFQTIFEQTHLNFSLRVVPSRMRQGFALIGRVAWAPGIFRYMHGSIADPAVAIVAGMA